MRVLTGIADEIDARAGDISAAEALGAGLPVAQAHDQAAEAAECFRRAADLVTARAAGDADPVPGQPGYLAQAPAGVAGVITHWRTPFLAQPRALAAALAAGCTVVLSPDVWTPLPAVLIAEIASAAGLPDAVLNISTAPATGAVTAMAQAPRHGMPWSRTRMWCGSRSPAIPPRASRSWATPSRTARSCRPSWPATRPASS